MVIQSLRLAGFRNYEDLDCSFDPGVNLIVGRNAQGKTNLLEAVCYLSRGAGFRTRREAELIRLGAEFAELEAVVQSYGRSQSLRAVMFAGRRPRQLFLSGVKKPSREALDGVLNTVLFCPEDLLVLKKGAAERRRLLDDALCQLRPRYARALEEYRRLLAQKAAALKDRYERPDMLELLPEYNERMAQTGAVIITTRARYLAQLSALAAEHHSSFSSGAEALRLEYKTVSTVTDPMAPAQQVYQQLRDHQQSHYRAELESMQCLSGPHKDDFEAVLNDLGVKSFGSQGQTRTCAISLKLAERDIFTADTGEEPVLLLDDVLSELDAGRQDFVLNRIHSGQVLITCCETDRVTFAGRTLLVEGGKVAQGDVSADRQ